MFYGKLESVAVIQRYNGKYIVHEFPEDDGSGCYDEMIEDVRVYESYKEALDDFDSIEYGKKSVKDQITDLKKVVGIEDIWIDECERPYNCLWNVKYRGNLILEKYTELTTYIIKEAVQQYQDKEKELCEKGI